MQKDCKDYGRKSSLKPKMSLKAPHLVNHPKNNFARGGTSKELIKNWRNKIILNNIRQSIAVIRFM